LFLSLFNSHIDLHLKVLINFFFFFFIIIIIIVVVVVVVVVLLLFIIYTINLPVVRPRSCRVIYYFDTPALGRRHQSFGRVKYPLHVINEGLVVGLFKDFYTPKGVERWVSITLSFFFKGHKKKQVESYGPIWGLERSSILYSFGLGKMLSLKMLGLIVC